MEISCTETKSRKNIIFCYLKMDFDISNLKESFLANFCAIFNVLELLRSKNMLSNIAPLYITLGQITPLPLFNKALLHTYKGPKNEQNVPL